MPTKAVDKRHWGSTSAQRIRRIYQILSEHIKPDSDLIFHNPFELLVAVVLSAQTTDIAVNKASATLFTAAPGPKELLALGIEGIIPHIRHIGLYNAKAKHVVGLCQALLDHHDGQVPDERAALEALPGVGRKTANVVLNIAFGQPTIAVDTHVHRVANRLGITKSKTVEQSEGVLLQRTPAKFLVQAHHYLLLHGRFTCIARKPRCESCPIARLCESQDKSV